MDPTGSSVATSRLEKIYRAKKAGKPNNTEVVMPIQIEQLLPKQIHFDTIKIPPG